MELRLAAELKARAFLAAFEGRHAGEREGRQGLPVHRQLELGEGDFVPGLGPGRRSGRDLAHDTIIGA
jgi:hypothetical protein